MTANAEFTVELGQNFYQHIGRSEIKPLRPYVAATYKISRLWSAGIWLALSYWWSGQILIGGDATSSISGVDELAGIHASLDILELARQSWSWKIPQNIYLNIEPQLGMVSSYYSPNVAKGIIISAPDMETRLLFGAAFNLILMFTPHIGINAAIALGTIPLQIGITTKFGLPQTNDSR